MADSHVLTGARTISLRGVRVHNLKNVDVDIPGGQLVAICGVSGSGKTSLALDTLYAEGQRRYIESFSAYTRQYLERLEKPDYDSIEGLTPALAVTRSGAPRGNRSTVGTASETLDYLRLLFANVAKLFCYQCGQEIKAHTPQSTAKVIEGLPRHRKLMLGFETSWEDIAERATILADLQLQGFVRLVASNQLINLGQDSRDNLGEKLPEQGRIWVIVDRLQGGQAAERSTESLEIAFEHGAGEVGLLLNSPTADHSGLPASSEGSSDVELSCEPLVIDGTDWQLARLSRQRKCGNCSLDYPDPEPRLFSFNSPLGACPRCEGFGDTIDLDWDLIVPDQNKSIRQAAIAPWTSPAYEHNLDELLDIAEDIGLPVDVPFRKLSKKQVRLIMEGAPQSGFEGLKGFFDWLERKKYKMHVRVFISRWRSYNRCTECSGARLSAFALSYRIGEKNIAELCQMEISHLDEFLSSLDFSERDQTISVGPLEQVRSRLGYLQSVGLGYLQLNRPLRTLSGGEAQRTALTAALGSSLVNMLYVLDEPSVGLHPQDVTQLFDSIQRLTQRGNTVVIVEHEEALLSQAQTLIEVGPLAGKQGGEIVYSGPRDAFDSADSLTADYLTGRRKLPIPSTRRQPTSHLRLRGCRGNNLKSIEVEFPLGVLCVVTGVSGSGKSSLIQDTLYGALANRLGDSNTKTLPFDSLSGLGQLEDCILVDQSPVSRSPRSNPVTYVKAFDEIRSAFAATTEAKMRNLTASHFSFNSDLGRCPTCQGDGSLQIDMQFLADVRMTCPACHGHRYRSEILTVKYRDRSIADVLEMTVSDASDFFRGSPKVQQKLKVLQDVGLGYIQLGQPATTLSSGEAQRLKLAQFLASASRRRTLFLLDEPTTGLHAHDIVQLLACFNALIEAGHSLIVVEHNLHLMAAADHIIDLGPGPADAGGNLVVVGTPEQVAACAESITGRFLSEVLKLG